MTRRDDEASTPDEPTRSEVFVPGAGPAVPGSQGKRGDTHASHAPTTMGEEDKSSPSRHGRTFANGDVIANRYTVVRFLAQGGMGEVYEVEDRDLGERVALKTILPRIAANEVALERFRREILFARKVTHPNVCRIFDIGKHVFSVDDPEEVTFLTMELLSGESLSRRLRQGPMTTAGALPLVRQIVDGLAAAHRAGVVHRDLKPANIFLVPENGDLRVVVTDFGLARFDAAGDAFKEVTATGELLGTPSYMSPEQLEGETPTAASDIYALGLLIYEMLTGARAFEGDTAFQMALKRLQEPPTAPSFHLPDIDPRWEGTILRCLARRPEDRFPDVAEISEVLSGERDLPAGIRTARWRRGAKRRLRHPLLWASLVVFAAALGMVAYRGLVDTPSATQEHARRSVAVLGFENVSQDSEAAWISTALSEILTTELAVGGGLRTIPGESVSRARDDLEIEHIQTLSPDTLGRLRGHLGSDLVVLGSYTTAAQRLRLDVRVQETATGELVVQIPKSGGRDELFDLAEGMATAIRSALGVTTADADQRADVLASLPSGPEAARLYSEGVERLRQDDALTASGLLTRASEADPSSAMIYAKLAEAWGALGHERQALGAAERAVELSESLEREQRTRIAAEYQVIAHRWDEAVASYRSLWTFFPDNLEYGLQLAGAHVAAGEGADALEVVAELRNLPLPDADDPRIDLAEARAWSGLGDPGKQVAAAQRGVAGSRARGSRLLTAEARLEEASALISLGRYDDAAASCEGAVEFFVESDNQHGVAVSRERLARIAYHRGDFPGAETEIREALRVSRRIGNRVSEAHALNLLGALMMSSGDLEGAGPTFEEVVKIAEDIGDRDIEARGLNNLAVLLQRRGDLSAAVDRLQQVLVLERARGNQSGEAWTLENVGGIYATEGDLARAREYYEQAMGVYRHLESSSDLARSLYWLGEVLLWQGEIDAARARHEEALEIRNQTGERGEAALSVLALAEVELHEGYLGMGSFEEAAASTTQAVNVFREIGWNAEEAIALSTLAEAELAMGNVDRAEDAVRRARTSLEGIDDMVTSLLVGIGGARVQAARGEVEAARRKLSDLLIDAHSASMLGQEYLIKLTMAEMEQTVGDPAEGRRQLEDLMSGAEARGWFLVSSRAARLHGQGRDSG